MKFAVSSVRFEEDAQKCMEHYQLEKFGGVVCSGIWMVRHDGSDEYHECGTDSWVEMELDFAQLEELLAHVRDLAPTTRPRFRGILVNHRPAQHAYGPGPAHWFEGPEIPAWHVTIYDSWMD